MNKKKTKLVEGVRRKMEEEFKDLDPEEITTKNIGFFMGRINSLIQKYAHSVVKRKGIPAHVERKQVKRTAKLIILKELNKEYPDQIIEYLFNKSYKIKFK